MNTEKNTGERKVPIIGISPDEFNVNGRFYSRDALQNAFEKSPKQVMCYHGTEPFPRKLEDAVGTAKEFQVTNKGVFCTIIPNTPHSSIMDSCEFLLGCTGKVSQKDGKEVVENLTVTHIAAILPEQEQKK